MKTYKTKFSSIIIFLCLCVGMAGISSCSSDDDNKPCPELECLNGGEKVTGADGCFCQCPEGFTGINCQEQQCPVYVECPIGMTANPNNDCKCE